MWIMSPPNYFYFTAHTYKIDAAVFEAKTTGIMKRFCCEFSLYYFFLLGS